MRYAVVTELSFEVETGKAVTHAPGAVIARGAIPETSIPWLLEQGHIRPETQAVASAPDGHVQDAPHSGGGGRRRRGEE